MEIKIQFEWNKSNNHLYLIYGFKYKTMEWVIIDSWKVPNHFYLQWRSVSLDWTDQFEYLTSKQWLCKIDADKITEMILNGEIKIEKWLFWWQYIDIPFENDLDKIIEKYSMLI